MKFSVNWLREFVQLPSRIEALAELLTLSGIEIEAMEERGADFPEVVVAQIIESTQHPNADRLTVCTVDDGSGKLRQIVCGAKNYKVGDKVPLALPGAELTGQVKIRANKLRGIESEGMLCSARELGLGDDASGLLILSHEAQVGAAIHELFPADTIFEVEITPNRGDLLSHFGLAREIAALLQTPLRSPGENGGGRAPTLQAGGITISAVSECSFYSARRIDKVKVGPSPDWLRARLESVGIRSINNIVDISNLVMLELGQPTHAFDAEKLRGDIHVRLAREGEKFLALDGRTYSLGKQNLVIADAERAIGIAGIMGGEDSGVSESTTTVLLESAYFSPTSVRRTARDLNLPSDASYRFERGVDPQMILRASQRVAELINELAGGKAADAVIAAGKLPPNPPDVQLRYDRLDRSLGTPIELATVDAILTRFGLQKNQAASGFGGWKIPSYRRDLQREVDLVEEVVRAYGIEKIASADRSRFTPLSEADREYDFEAELRARLAGLGLNEVRTPALIARSELGKSGQAVALRNPRSEDHVALRTSLIPGLLATLARNVRAGAERVALFEMGNVFAAPTGEQKRRLAVVLNGQISSEKNWRGEKNRRFDFFDVKGAVEALGSLPRDGGRQQDGDDHRTYYNFRDIKQHPFVVAAEIFHGETGLGICGQLTAAEASRLDLSGAVLVAELNLAALAQMRRSGATFSELERFPAMRRDIAMFVDSNVRHEEILRVISSAREPLLERVELFDLFSAEEAKEIPEVRKSLAYSLTYRDKSRTLTSEEVSAVHARIRERLRKEIGAELRE